MSEHKPIMERALEPQMELVDVQMKIKSLIQMNKPITDTERRTGRTTRLIDQMVQEFFINGRVGITDHHKTNDRTTFDNLIRDNKKKLLSRLANEHRLFAGKDIEIDGDWLINKRYKK